MIFVYYVSDSQDSRTSLSNRDQTDVEPGATAMPLHSTEVPATQPPCKRMRGETRDRGGEYHPSSTESVGEVGESKAPSSTADSATVTTQDQSLCSAEKEVDEQDVMYADDLVDCFVVDESEAMTTASYVTTHAQNTNSGVGTSSRKRSDDDSDDDRVVVRATTQAQAPPSAPPMTVGALVRAVVDVLSEAEGPQEIADAVRSVLVAVPQRARDVAAWAERALARPPSALAHGDEVALRIALDLVRRVAVDVAGEVKVVGVGSTDK